MVWPSNNNQVRAALIAALSVVSAVSAHAHSYTTGDLKIVHPWSRATPVAAPVAGGYLSITNSGSEPEVLLGGTSSRSASVEVHQSTTTDGVARMRPISDGLVIEPGQTVQLVPGATHLMFVKPTAPFKEGEKVEAILNFKNAGEIKVEFRIQGMGAKAPSGTETHQGHGN